MLKGLLSSAIARIILFFVLGIAFLGAYHFVACAQTPSSTPPKGFVSLFNGADFSGWNIQPDSGAWHVKDGLIQCKGRPRVPYAILTQKKYENFELYVDFNMSKGCNSGIFLHVPESGRESRVGCELQIQDDYGKPASNQSVGSIYSVKAPEVNAIKKAGEWNTYRIRFDWPKLQAWLNGQKIHDVDFEQVPELRFRLRNGYIGLQNHGHAISFRNIYIKELPAKEKWTELFNKVDLQGWQKLGDADWRVEEGTLVASGGKGYLVTDDEYENFEFQAYVDMGQKRDGGGFYYRWKSIEEPGYKTEFYDHELALKLNEPYMLDPGKRKPSHILSPAEHPYLLTQILSLDRVSSVRWNGIEIQKNLLHAKVYPGHIAIFHAPGDGEVRIRQIRIKQLDFTDF